MERYLIAESLVREAMGSPDHVLPSYGGRKVAQKRLGDHVLRVVFEEREGLSVVVTVYKARRGRYEV